MNRNQLVFAFVILVAFFLGGFLNSWNKVVKNRQINDFKSCGEMYPVLELYPRQCRTPDGRVFKEDVGNEMSKENLIMVASPRPNETIESPVKISGQARGFWFFEGNFPVRIVDEENNVLAQTGMSANGEWMTEDFVPFSGTIEFSKPSSGAGSIIFIKDNPSGDPQYDDALIVPINFK